MQSKYSFRDVLPYLLAGAAIGLFIPFLLRAHGTSTDILFDLIGGAVLGLLIGVGSLFLKKLMKHSE